jgi:hypothetical protein
VRGLLAIGVPAESALMEHFFDDDGVTALYPALVRNSPFTPQFNLRLLQRRWELVVNTPRDRQRGGEDVISLAATTLGQNAIPWLLQLKAATPEFTAKIDETIANLNRLPQMP